jgi:hypothetical protein
MIDFFNTLWEQTRPAFSQQRTHERARRLAMSALLCLGRHTITGWISTGGHQAVDWSADFRLFEKERFDPQQLFSVIRRNVSQRLEPDSPLVVFMDDTLLRKWGTKTAGASWRRDPLGPPFQTNLIWGQRFVQISAALPEQQHGPGRARAIPIDLLHCPSPRKPSRKADKEQWRDYRLLLKQTNMARQGGQRLEQLRKQMDQTDSERSRPLIACVDGSYTNRTVLRSLPERTTLIGRIRKDAKLYALPTQTSPGGPGRKKAYGPRVPTPEQLRQDSSLPWESVEVFAAGRTHQIQFKTLAPIRWRAAGENRNLRLIVIRPLAYRRNKHSRLLYRQPAYLICTDPTLPIQQLIQFYLWRWEIECNFRDEKTLLGMQQPQVRTPSAVTSVPAFLAAAYAFLLLASSQMNNLNKCVQTLRPKWRKAHPSPRASTSQLLSLFRKQLWGKGIDQSYFSGFVNHNNSLTTLQKLENSLHKAVLFAHG